MAKFIARDDNNNIAVVDDDPTFKQDILNRVARGEKIYRIKPQGDGNFLLVLQRPINVEYQQIPIAADFEDDVE